MHCAHSGVFCARDLWTVVENFALTKLESNLADFRVFQTCFMMNCSPTTERGLTQRIL